MKKNFGSRYNDRNLLDKRTDLAFTRLKYSGPYLKRQELIVKLLEEQNGRCAICEEILFDPELDHNHDTDEIRGLLCPKCNRGIGQFKDNPLLLVKAIEYLTGIELEIPDPK